MKVVILAGGLGTRLAEETDSRPKPMVEIGGRPILWHIMKHYAAHGLDEFVLALGLQGRGDQAVLPRLRGTSRQPAGSTSARGDVESDGQPPSRTGSCTSSTPAWRRSPAGASGACARWLDGEHVHGSPTATASPTSTCGELLALPPRARPARDGHRRPAAGPLRRARLRRRPRDGVHREAADRRRLDQRRLLRLRARALRLPRRRRDEPRGTTRSSASRPTASSWPTGTRASGSAWTRSATSACSRRSGKRARRPGRRA